MRPVSWWLASVCTLLPLAFGCSGSTPSAKGELILSIQTDMSIPKDVDQVRLEVLVYGNTLFANDYDVGPSGLKIPATIALVAGKDTAAPVNIRVLARQKGIARTLREVITTVPPDRIALLRIPIQWLCDGEVSEPSAGQVQSTCPEEQTCVAGRCESSHLDSATFPNYAPELVFGGAPAPDLSGQCLDTLGCFAQGYIAAVNRDSCTIDRPLGGVGLNVALVTSPHSDGICGPSFCMIPLDADSAEGWTDENGKIQLPLAVCDRLSQGKILGVALTTACETKTASIPTCGPWSSVQGENTPDAGAPDGLFGDSSDDAPQDSPPDGLFGDSSDDAFNDSATDALLDQVSEPPECTIAQDCPGQDTECSQRRCNSYHCEIVNVPANQPLSQQNAGDCRRRECDGHGQPIDIVDDSDLPVDGRQCTLDLCFDGSATNPSQADMPCSENGGQRCDGYGQCIECRTNNDCTSDLCEQYHCVPLNCIDSTIDEDETGIDCGGSCPKCPAGQGCNSGLDCQSASCQGHGCTQASCTDGITNGLESGIDCGESCHSSCSCDQSPACQGMPCCATSRIAGNSFMMGRNESGGSDAYAAGQANEVPEHSALVADFDLDMFEVTVGRFRRFLTEYPPVRLVPGAGASPSAPESGWQAFWNASLPPTAAALIQQMQACPNSNWTATPGANETFPINCITWYEAFAFCLWDDARLPTEAEWEYVAAGGDQNLFFPWGDQSAWPDRTRANYNGSGASPHVPVGSYPEGAASYGQRDLAGSMWEYVLDAYTANWYENPCEDCCNTSNCTTRMVRGGSWKSAPEDLRSVVRRAVSPGSRSDEYSMRCARKVQLVRRP